MIPANIQDRDCAANLIRKTRQLFPWVAKIFADGGYAGDKLKAALAGQPVTLEIVKRTDNDGGFKVVRRRWVIERTLSWLRRNRRLMAHYEAFAFIAEGFAKLAMTCVMLKRLTEPKPMSATYSSESGSEAASGRATDAQVLEDAERLITGRSKNSQSFRRNKFRKLGFIGYGDGIEGGIEIHTSLLNAVLHDRPQNTTQLDKL